MCIEEVIKIKYVEVKFNEISSFILQTVINIFII